jgi:hypothetical protein
MTIRKQTNDKNFQDKDEVLLQGAKWYIEGLDKRLVRHRVRLVVEPSLSLKEWDEAS